MTPVLIHANTSAPFCLLKGPLAPSEPHSLIRIDVLDARCYIASLEASSEALMS